MLLLNQLNSFANFAFNLLICIVSLYLFIHFLIFFSKKTSVCFFLFVFFVSFFSMVKKNTNKLK